MSSSTFCKDFQYGALPDPATHVRLIEICQGDQDGGDIEIDISPWPLADVPTYHAVSYTWGDATLTENIRVTGSEWVLRVRQNCANVLRQAFHFKSSSTGYYWVDAICINQDDNDEKSKQVAMMGDIFESAECVLACVGMHDESSQHLARALHSFDGVLERFDVSLLPLLTNGDSGDGSNASDDDEEPEISPETGRCLSLCAGWFELMPDEDAHQFMKALDEFPQRSYFWRIWILQELYLARDIRIFCGFDELSLQSLLFWWRKSKLWFPSLLAEKLPESFIEQAPWTDGEYFLDQGGSGLGDAFEDILFHSILPQPRERLQIYEDKVLELCTNRKCYDPRDIVYGTLRLIGWNGVQPDYGKSSFDLAVETASRLDNATEFLQFLSRLHVNPDDLEVLSRIASRSASSAIPEIPGEDNIPEFPDEIRFAAGGFQITSDPAWEILSAQHNDATSYRIMSPAGSLTATANTQVSVNDWLVRTTRNFGVVLRQMNRFYRIVGSARFVTETELPAQLKAFLMFFDPEDLVLHLIQDLGLSGSGALESSGRGVSSLSEMPSARVCREPLSSWGWAPTKGPSFPRAAFFDVKPDFILPLLLVSYHTSFLPSDVELEASEEQQEEERFSRALALSQTQETIRSRDSEQQPRSEELSDKSETEMENYPSGVKM